MDLFRLVPSALEVLGEAPAELQIVQVGALIERHYPHLNTDVPALIGVISDRVHAQSLSACLRWAYPDDHRVSVIWIVGGEALKAHSAVLDRLQSAVIEDGATLLYVPALSYVGSVVTFQNTVAHLRAPDGCPWDRSQTHRSLRQGFQEEAYEVLDALDRGDLEALQEELGDVLLHILLQAQIATETGEFRMSDIVHHVQTKIVYRHPHVFGGLHINGVEEVLVNWETLKQREKEARIEDASALDGISRAMPALARAQSIQRHVDRTGVVSDEIGDLIERITKQVEGLSVESERSAYDQVLGDLLFDLANLARGLGVDAESTLREANDRFEQRFRAIERVRAIRD